MRKPKGGIMDGAMEEKPQNEGKILQGLLDEISPRGEEGFFTLVTRSVLLGHEGLWPESLSCLNRALEVSPAELRPRVLLMRGFAHYMLGRYAEALQDLQGCLEGLGEDKRGHALTLLAETYRALGAHALALEAVEEALEANPRAGEAKLVAATIHLDQGNLGKALEEIQGFLQGVGEGAGLPEEAEEAFFELLEAYGEILQGHEGKRGEA